MTNPQRCPLCADTFDTETDLRVHLEVEHRKSELAVYVVDHRETRTDPLAERDAQAPIP